ncbi:MAG: ABC transporter ATP-binding protein [Chloroflexota bacterium]|nr:ABC transporter ATP-binding protein [Chloroflexota bacterium]NOG62708.1 ABC transporter ATP-binding protein [Chloroflexota bacterium]GIK63083.1 MAG: ABC transporter ATP-binding protein [Chloroflexota bacterium]
MTNSPTPTLVSEHVTKTFDKTAAVRDLTFTLDSGQFFALLGPSGCGKTTSLRLMAGLETPTSGNIQIGGQVVASENTWLPPNRRRVGLVFQDYALFPHLDVWHNIAYGLDGTRPSKKQRVEEVLTLVGLSGMEKRMPHQLSGGQQQRVALARALAPAPAIMLLDEPFSNLDAALRAQVREDVRQILKTAGISTVLVTHDQEEALSLADVVGVMFDGALVQVAPPPVLYQLPATATVARFVGDANLIAGEADGDTVQCALGRLPLQNPVRGRVEVMIRPESVSLIPVSDNSGNAQAERVSYFGHDQIVELRLRGEQSVFRARLGPTISIRQGQEVKISINGAVIGFERADTHD